MAETSDGGAASEVTAKKPSKRFAVERSFAELGGDAMPKAVQADVKKRFKLDVSDNYISTIKAELAGKAGAAKTPAAGKPAQAAVKKPAAAAPAGNGKKVAVSLDDVLALKAIVGRVGASSARTLIDALSS